MAHTAVEQMLHFDLRKAAQYRRSKDKMSEEGVVERGEVIFSWAFLSVLSVIHLDFA